jgi:mannose-6-phosphate isomerase-like protein (cupin superfamily)
MFHKLKAVDFVEHGGRTAHFDGEAYGANVSFFLVDIDPGEGPPLHRHGYPETWIVKNGNVEFTVASQKSQATAGDILVVPPLTQHKFTNAGSSTLNMVCIHANGRIEQEDIEETS